MGEVVFFYVFGCHGLLNLNLEAADAVNWTNQTKIKSNQFNAMLIHNMVKSIYKYITQQ